MIVWKQNTGHYLITTANSKIHHKLFGCSTQENSTTESSEDDSGTDSEAHRAMVPIRTRTSRLRLSGFSGSATHSRLISARAPRPLLAMAQRRRWTPWLKLPNQREDDSNALPILLNGPKNILQPIVIQTGHFFGSASLCVCSVIYAKLKNNAKLLIWKCIQFISIWIL